MPGRHLATGSFDGRLQTWDLEKPEQAVYDATAHQGIVNGIDGFGGQVPIVAFMPTRRSGTRARQKMRSAGLVVNATPAALRRQRGAATLSS